MDHCSMHGAQFEKEPPKPQQVVAKDKFSWRGICITRQQTGTRPYSLQRRRGLQ
jgi:hypothetical protein